MAPFIWTHPCDQKYWNICHTGVSHCSWLSHTTLFNVFSFFASFQSVQNLAGLAIIFACICMLNTGWIWLMSEGLGATGAFLHLGLEHKPNLSPIIKLMQKDAKTITFKYVLQYITYCFSQTISSANMQLCQWIGNSLASFSNNGVDWVMKTKTLIRVSGMQVVPGA